MSQIEVLEPPTVVVRIKVADLKVGPSFREGGLCPEHVERLMTLGGSWPPIVVDSDGLVIDGAHRVIAARRLRWARLDAVLFEGGSEEAFIEFVRRNVAHGLLLTLRERKRAAVRVLGSHREWSDRRLAEVCGISPKTVGRLRLDVGCPTEEVAQLDGGSRVGRDDRRRPVQRGSARARVVEALRAQPSGSLRAVAAVAGVSPETVRLVRMNLTQSPQSADTVAEIAAGDESVAWRADAALASCDAGEEFLSWFERTQIADADMARVHAVPLSRIYDLAKEARRRSEGWLHLARALEARTRVN
jgi:ParB-like chromosome segregation protein Spo0J